MVEKEHVQGTYLIEILSPTCMQNCRSLLTYAYSMIKIFEKNLNTFYHHSAPDSEIKFPKYVYSDFLLAN